MNRCPITYEPLAGHQAYSPQGLRLLNRSLKSLGPLEFTAQEQRQEAINRAGKMSIQGLQLKLSAVLRIRKGRFGFVVRGGRKTLNRRALVFPKWRENKDFASAMPRC